MKKLKRILSAWYKLIRGIETIQSRKRMSICHSCNERIGEICGKCGCILAAKVLEEDEHCPLLKW